MKFSPKNSQKFLKIPPQNSPLNFSPSLPIPLTLSGSTATAAAVHTRWRVWAVCGGAQKEVARVKVREIFLIKLLFWIFFMRIYECNYVNFPRFSHELLLWKSLIFKSWKSIVREFLFDSNFEFLLLKSHGFNQVCCFEFHLILESSTSTLRWGLS